MNKAKLNQTKNYTLLVVSYESNDGAAADKRAVADFKNHKLMAKQGLLGNKVYKIEMVHPLSNEEINNLTLS